MKGPHCHECQEEWGDGIKAKNPLPAQHQKQQSGGNRSGYVADTAADPMERQGHGAALGEMVRQ